MSKYSNFVGYVPDRLRLITSGGALVQGELGLPNEYIASLAFGPVSTGNPVSGPGLGLSAAATFVIESGSSYINFQNLSATTNSIFVTGEGEGGTVFEASFDSLEYVGNQITGRSDRLKKLNLPALKRVDSSNSFNARGIYYSGGHDVTGEVYSPNLVQVGGSGVFIGYGSGGLANLNNTFNSFVSGTIIISGYPGFDTGNTQILPNSDFITGIKRGNVTFYAGSNWENIAIAQNYTGIPGATSVLTYWTHQNTTGVDVPSLQNCNRSVFITSSTEATGDLTVNLQGPEAISGRISNLSIYQRTPGRDVTINNNSDGYLNTTTAVTFSLLSSGSITFNGNNWQGVTRSVNGGTGIPTPSNAQAIIISGTNNTVFSTTGSTFDLRNSDYSAVIYGVTTFWGVYKSLSGNVTVNLSNTQTVHAGFVFQLNGSGTTGVYSLPEAVSGATLYPGAAPIIDLRVTPASATAVDTVQTLNIPKLHSIPRDISVETLSGSTVTVSGADITFISGILSIASSGNTYFTFTGGPGSGSGFIKSGVFITGYLPGATISGDFGSIATISGNLNVISSGNTDLQLTGLSSIVSGVFITGFVNNININSSLIPGTTAVIDAISGAISITGGHTGPATGAMSSGFFITGRTSDAAITGIFNGIQTISGNLNLSSSGNTNIQLTGLTTIVSGLQISAQDTAAAFVHPLDNNSSLTAVSTSYTGYTEYYYPIIISGDAITGASASALTTVGNISGQAGHYGGYIVSTGMTNFSMPNVTGWHTQTEFDLPNVTGFNMTGVTFLGGLGVYNRGLSLQARTWQGFWLKLGSTLTGALDFSNLTDIHYYSNNGHAGYGYFVVNPMRIYATGITSIDMSGIVSGVYKPAWRDVNSVLIPSETATTEFTCPALTGLTFGASGTTQRLIMNFNASGSPLNEASVDSILQTFASLDGTAGTSTYSGLTITLNGLCAPPSATGSGYRDTLTGAGRNCTVLINP